MADWTSEDWVGALQRADRTGRLVARRAAARHRSAFFAGAVRRHLRLAGAALAILLALAAGLALQARREPAPAPLQDVRPALEPPAWSPILRPVPGFAIETPLFPAEQTVLAARRHNPGGGREEVFTLGRPGAPQGFARIVVYRTGSEAGPPGTLFLELARRAAEDGLALLHAAQPRPLASKFGPIEAADMVLAGADGEWTCTAWRIVADEQDLRVTGWLCPAQGKGGEENPRQGSATSRPAAASTSADVRLADRSVLSCLVDRLQLASAQPDAGLRAYFKEAERRRTPGCPASRPVSAGRRPA